MCESDSSNLNIIREKLLSRLPKDISNALRSYERINADIEIDDMKTFAAQQAASRAVLSHIQLLIRLADWAQGYAVADDDGFDDDDVDRLIRDAEAYIGTESLDSH